jgi:hypothetical protein
VAAAVNRRDARLPAQPSAEAAVDEMIIRTRAARGWS